MGAPGMKNIAIAVVLIAGGFLLKSKFNAWDMAYLFYGFEVVGLALLAVGIMQFFRAKGKAEGASGGDSSKEIRNEVLLKTLARMTYADTNTKAVEVQAVKKIYKSATGKTISDAEIRVAARGDLHETKEFSRYLASCQSKISAEDKAFIIRAMADVVKSDGSVSPGEIEFFDQVGKAFKINPSEIADLKK